MLQNMGDAVSMNSRQNQFRLLGLSGLLIVATAAALAQGDAALSGSVVDPSGSAVAGTTVTAASPETGAIRKTTTNAGGHYDISLLGGGSYDISAEKTGFQTELR